MWQSAGEGNIWGDTAETGNYKSSRIEWRWREKFVLFQATKYKASKSVQMSRYSISGFFKASGKLEHGSFSFTLLFWYLESQINVSYSRVGHSCVAIHSIYVQLRAICSPGAEWRAPYGWHNDSQGWIFDHTWISLENGRKEAGLTQEGRNILSCVSALRAFSILSLFLAEEQVSSLKLIPKKCKSYVYLCKWQIW